jgi:hypothetical protein
LKFRLAPVFSQHKIKIDLKQEPQMMDNVDMAIRLLFVKNQTLIEIVTSKIPLQIPAKKSCQNMVQRYFGARN